MIMSLGNCPLLPSSTVIKKNSFIFQPSKEKLCFYTLIGDKDNQFILSHNVITTKYKYGADQGGYI